MTVVTKIHHGDEPDHPQAADDLTFSELSRAMDDFVAAKGWYQPTSKRPQTPRNLATSLAIEVGELLECFQWDDRGEASAIADELADIVLYAVQLAHVSKIPLSEAITSKLRRNYRRTWDEVQTRTS